MPYCQIFVNSQSALAHFLVFQTIHNIVQDDTGQGLLWRHLHSESIDDPVGILSFIVDFHLGQAQGTSIPFIYYSSFIYSAYKIRSLFTKFIQLR